MSKNSNVAKNSIMLIALNVAKIIFPFMTLPYLTRVLSTDSYGTVAYVKALMGYMQVLVDYGFMLSGTKMVVEAGENKEKIGKIIGDVTFIRILLGICGMIIVMICCLKIPLLHHNFIFVLLSYIVVFLSIFLMDFLFRGIEKMEIITLRFVIMKGISTFLTFICVKSDENILLIPMLDIISTIIAILAIIYEIKKMDISISFSNISMCWLFFKESSIYFISSVASVSFNAFNTIVLGIVLSTTDIAYWSICVQIISAIQMLYTPVSDALYPEMVRSQDFKLIHKVLKIFIPILVLGCVFTFGLGKIGLYIIGGAKYVQAVDILRILIPVIFFGFLSVLFGWPVLGAVGLQKQTTKSTIISILFQISVIIVLLIFDKITLFTIALTRSITEIILFGIRYYYFCTYKKRMAL